MTSDGTVDRTAKAVVEAAAAGAADDAGFTALLDYLREARGFDFTGYKRNSLMRRVRRRMNQVRVSDYVDYRDLLEADTDEFTALFDTILIKVTGFFRDQEPWDQLRTEVLPTLLQGRDSEPLRVWSAGCATGEEPYSIAMLCAEVLGAEEFRQRVKIYATDVDDGALAVARHGSYEPAAMESVPAELRERYFEREGSRYTFRRDLRRPVIFGRNDLVRDAPISRVHLLVCRNTVMYFNAETQAGILDRFHFALHPDGHLFLGKAEMLVRHSGSFAPTHLKSRLFRKVGDGRRHRLPVAGRQFADEPCAPAADQLSAAAFAAGPAAQVVLTDTGVVAACNAKAEALFGIGTADVGALFQDLALSYRPAELRSHVDAALATQAPRSIPGVEWHRSPGDRMVLDIEVVPLLAGERAIGLTLSFTDITESRLLTDDLEQSNRQLETAYEELRSTNEELETTNEELQSTVEELETTNEELQSTNEELETMNEELQSMNDELTSLNEELRERSEEIDTVNGFHRAVLGGLRSGVIVVDRGLRVLAWNRRATHLWGLHEREAVGQDLFSLDFGLGAEELSPLLREVLAGTSSTAEVQVPTFDRRGRSVLARVSGSPLAPAGERVSGVILVVDVEEEPVGVSTG